MQSNDSYLKQGLMQSTHSKTFFERSSFTTRSGACVRARASLCVQHLPPKLHPQNEGLRVSSFTNTRRLVAVVGGAVVGVRSQFRALHVVNSSLHSSPTVIQSH